MAQTEQPVVITQPPKTSTTRRKLVRGAFALPAIATVHSGSALAASSSLRCLTNGPSALAPPFTISKAAVQTPVYLRLELAVAQTTDPLAPMVRRWYVSYDDLQAMANALGVGINISPAMTPGSFIRFIVNNGTNAMSGPVLTRSGVEVSGRSLVDVNTVPLGQRRLAVLIFNPQGTTIVGVGKATTASGHAATQSCWTSFGTIP
jgi:hypothetical protein